MKKPIIEFYINKVAEGEKSYLPMLCEHLADRLIYVPLAAPVRAAGDTTKVSIMRLNEGGKILVPIFTSERKFKNWCFSEGHNDTSITLLGGDLCAVLDESYSLLIDRGSEASATLAPDSVQRIAQSGIEEAASFEEQNTVPAQAMAESTPVVEPPSYQPAPELHQPEPKNEFAAGDTMVQPAAAIPIAAREPVQIYHEEPSAAATLVGKPYVGRKGENGSLPKAAAELPKKKKSFLSFLRSGK